jgi:hypothetical protein
MIARALTQNRKEKINMRNAALWRSLVLIAVGVVLGGLVVSTWKAMPKAQQGSPSPGPAAGPATMQADVAHLKDLVPPNSHPMVDVGYHVVNLWFAVQKRNWPLANYYLGETRNRLRWEVRLNPAPKGPTGEPVNMKSTLDGIENGSYNLVKQAIDNKDATEFTVAYKHLLEDCYSCHKAAGRLYLRPMVPVTPQQVIINTDATATWPQ